MATATDWLGREYGPGDLVFYSKGYGQSGSQIVLAEVVNVNENTVTAKVLQGSRSGKSSSYAYIDSRTGRRIGYSDIHVKKQAHYRHKTTGEERDFRTAPGYRDPDRGNWEYIPDQYWEYVVKGPYVTTFGIKDNITKVPEGFTWPPENKNRDDAD